MDQESASGTLEVITAIIAVYGAIVSSVLGVVAILRDRHRLRIRVQWITGPEPGITVRCVNRGHRPIGVEQIFGGSRSFARIATSLPPGRNAEVLGWVGEAHPKPPSVPTPLPAHLELGREVVVHYRLDERFRRVAGVVVWDVFGRSHKYKLGELDRIGLVQALLTESTTVVLDGQQLRAAAARAEAERGEAWQEHRDAMLELAAQADRIGPLEIVVGPSLDSSQGFVVARKARPGQAAITESPSSGAEFVRVTRPPFPWLAVGGALLASLCCAAAAIWLKDADVRVSVPWPFVVGIGLVALVAITIVAARELERRFLRRAAKEKQGRHDVGS